MPRSRSLLALGALLAVLLAGLLAGCSTDPSAGSTTTSTPATDRTGGAEPGAYPVTVEHAFGRTTIDREPRRVATLGWTDQDHAVALGVVPIGATKLTWGGNGAGSSDWFDDALTALGGRAPTRYDDTDGVPVEEIAKLAPDLILATNSGITEADYTRLSAIAPVVAYPEAAWVTPWRTSLETVGRALGRPARAARIAAETERTIAAARSRHPELADRRLIFAYLATTDLSTIGIYSPQDPRVSFLHDLGMVDAPAVASAVEPGKFYGSVSAERAPELRSDVLLTWAETAEDLATFRSHPLVGRIPALAEGHAYAETDKHVALAVTNPTPLSVPVIVDAFVPHVVAALAGA
jgi:iron complex transport system substrate-binding protein